jgi:chitin disaccharide deacetylase
MNRKLIVNADDFNTDGPRNRGILEAARRGIVTSTSVLANAAWPEGALHELKAAFGPRIGIHLNLTKGRPLCKIPGSLIAEDGCFFFKRKAWRRAIAGGFDPCEIEREFVAQIEALLSAGISLDHIDSNNHLHVFPTVAEVTARVAQQYRIGRIRLPFEPLGWSLTRPGPGLLKKCFISLFAIRARAVFCSAGLRFPERCAGLLAPDVRSATALVRFLKRLPDGATELMCHPGYACSENPFSTHDRERELAALTADDVLDIIKKKAIALISFSDIPCA